MSARATFSLSFDPANLSERIRAARIVKDMIRRGFALLVEVERDGQKRFERALDFDQSQCRYIIADFDPVVAEESDAWSTVNHEANKSEIKLKENVGGEIIQTEAAPIAPSTGKSRRGRPKRTSVDAGTTRAVAVGRSAGG